MTTTELTLSDTWVEVSSEPTLVQVQDISGCHIHIGTTEPNVDSAYIKLAYLDTYTYTPLNDHLYARAPLRRKTKIGIVK